MKKLQFTLLLSTIVFLGITSCSSDEKILSEPHQLLDNAYPYQKIIERANYYYGQLPGKTRTNTPLIASIQQISNKITRTDLDDNTPIYYLINYENDEGFVIVGANEVADPMVAISDECNLSLSDTIYNKGLASFINTLNKTPLPTESIDNPDPLPENVSVGPLLNSKVRKWGQRFPFNAYMPLLSNGETALTGCHPLACAMYMSYFEHPSSHNGRKLNWNNIINDYYNDDLAFILYDLGTASNLNADYSLSGTSVYPVNLKRTFQNYGYDFPTSSIRLTSFDFSSKFKVTTQLPMYIYGNGSKDDELYGHAWIIDGVFHLQIPLDMNTGTLSNEYYYHCVWGWYGTGNGYFKANNVNSIGGERYASDGTDGTSFGHKDSDIVPLFDIVVRGLYGIRPEMGVVAPGIF